MLYFVSVCLTKRKQVLLWPFYAFCFGLDVKTCVLWLSCLVTAPVRMKEWTLIQFKLEDHPKSEVLWGQKLNKVSDTIFWQDHCMHERWLEWCLTCSIKIECHLQPQSTLIFSLIISLSLKWWRWGFCRWNSPSACRTRPISGTPSILTKRSWKGRQTTSKNWSNKSNLSSTPQKVSSKGPNYGTIFCLESSQVLQVKPCFILQAFNVVWRASVLSWSKSLFCFLFISKVQ